MEKQTSTEASSPKAHAVTGAFGFTGKYLARRLLDDGKRVVTLTNSPNRPNIFAGRIETRPLDFADPEALAASLADVQVLYNTYWVRFNHADFSHAKAVRDTLALFEAARKAGVERVVHVSITNADPKSPLEYFSAKGHLEKALAASGLCHAIVRPAVLFGDEGILINNIAWALRRFPVFCLFGTGEYSIRPVHVDDLAMLMQAMGDSRETALVNALGPEEFTYRDLVGLIAKAIGCERRLISLPARLTYGMSWVLGKLVQDELLTWEEVQGLMANTLHVPGAPATGTTVLSDWVADHSATLGIRYKSEMDRRMDREKEYA